MKVAQLCLKIGFAQILMLAFGNLGCASGGHMTSSVQTVEHVDLNRYLGRWYEVASIPQSFQKKCISNTTADYEMSSDSLIRVMNSCETKDGSRKVAEGRAKVVNSESNAKLKVTFVKLIKWILLNGPCLIQNSYRWCSDC